MSHPPDLYQLKPCPVCDTHSYASSFVPQAVCLDCLARGVRTDLEVVGVYLYARPGDRPGGNR